MIPFLTLLLVGMTVCLVLALLQRARHRAAAEIPAGYRVLAADLAPGLRIGGRGALLLRDNEWGIAGKVDLLLEGPHGAVVPVEYKSAGAGFKPGRVRPSHVLQLAGAMLLCEGDRRVGRRPAAGWLRYIDDTGRVVPGGAIRIENTPALREQLLDVVQRMRRALVTGTEMHRDQRSGGRCRRCSQRETCGEAPV
jgi:CRISPR/Cas system-associated exonuclease Cas4 (RecB family)